MDEQREYPFEFSVVMAVYNVEPFLREAVDSLIAQDFGFEKIQLIMVDDGSTDGSGAICDEYVAQFPENVMVIHKKNGGVASARNEGLKYATGRYLNFMDSDDKFTNNAFSSVYMFFIKCEPETDIVTVPLRFFDGSQEEHWQNYKFKKGTRVLDLFWDYQATLMFVNASFFAARIKNDIIFDSGLVCSEDIKVALTILAEKMKLGVVGNCRYLYRRRSTGEASLIQTKEGKREWYFDYFTYLVDWAVEFYRKKLGFLPAFLQYELLSDLQWRFKQIPAMENVLREDEIKQYQDRLFSTLRYFDDKYILEQKKIWDEHKCYMLAKKYGREPELTQRKTNLIVHFGNTMFNSVADQYSKLEFLKIKDGRLELEGFTKILGVTKEEPLQVFLKANDELYPCEIIERESINEYRFEELIFRGVGFHCSIPLDSTEENYKIKLVLRCRECDIEKRDIRLGQFMPFSKKYKSAYYFSENWAVQLRGNTLKVNRCGRRGHVRHELDFLKELWKKNAVGGRKAVLARLAYHVLKAFKKKPIWLVSDRILKADDNGEAFFRYMQEEHKKETRTYFVLSKDSDDYARLRKLGPVVDNLSWKHKMLLLLCDYNISAQADVITANPFPGYEDGFRDILSKQRFVFLQHGVTKDDVSSWLNRFHKNLYGFVVSAYPEYQSILSGNYFYDEDQIWLTGFPRFDRRYRDEKNYITIMPTWRMYLMEAMDKSSGLRKLKPGFKESTYFKFYQGLLNDKKLIAAAKKFGYQLCFFAHPNIQPHLSEFDLDPSIAVLDINTEYNDVYAQSNLVVTDYSSACFDFAYLRKPIIYCQFDAKEFFAGGHVYTKGYFDYERDGFGEVEYDLEGTVDRIIEYMENGCQLKETYRKRIDQFFSFSDQNNCQRVYEKIMELEGKA